VEVTVDAAVTIACTGLWSPVTFSIISIVRGLHLCVSALTIARAQRGVDVVPVMSLWLCSSALCPCLTVHATRGGSVIFYVFCGGGGASPGLGCGDVFPSVGGDVIRMHTRPHGQAGPRAHATGRDHSVRHR